MFTFVSKEFTTIKELNSEKKRLMEELCTYTGVERSQLRLPLGQITLYGITNSSKHIPITNRITDFPERIKSKEYKSYCIATKLSFKNI